MTHLSAMNRIASMISRALIYPHGLCCRAVAMESSSFGAKRRRGTVNVDTSLAELRSEMYCHAKTSPSTDEFYICKL